MTSGDDMIAVYHDTCHAKFSDAVMSCEAVECHMRATITEDGASLGGPGSVATERSSDNGHSC